MRAGVITELAFIADEQVSALSEGGQSDVDTPLEVQFTEFMDGGISWISHVFGVARLIMMVCAFSVNSRGKGTRTRQRKMTIEQAAAVLLVTVVISISPRRNSASWKCIILGPKRSCRTDHQKGRSPHHRCDKVTPGGKENVGDKVSNQRTYSTPWTDLQHFFPN